MEGSGGTEGSKTCLSYPNEDEEESEDNNYLSKPKDGGSSSNSTVEENDKKSSIRPYVRSKSPRLRWTHDLHLRFVQAVESLGGDERATPKLVLQFMNIKGLNISHVKSHLQMYRSKKIDDPSQVVAHQRLFLEGRDGNIYNMSDLPMLQSYKQRHYSTFRYGDASWNGNEKWMHSSFKGRRAIDKAKPRFYGTFAERIFGSNYRMSSANCDLHVSSSSFNEQPTRRIHELKDEFISSQECLQGQSLQNTIEFNPLTQFQAKVQIPLDLGTTMSLQPRTMGKRKVSDLELNLDLTLGVKSENDNQRDMEDEHNLSLSLYSPSSLKLSRLREGDSSGNARETSTLNLTI